MLKSIITYLNLKLDLLNYFDLTRCLVELKEDSEGTRQPVEYISNGDYDVINWDEFNGVSYWRLRDEITSDRTEERKYKAGSRNNIETTVPLKLVFAVPRTKLTEDDAYSFDRIRQTMVKQFAIDDDVIKTTLQAESVRINVVTANSDAKDVWEDETGGTGTFEPKYETVFGSIDIDVVIISKHSCLPTECDDVESDILRAFDWCGNTAVTVGRLTPTQQTCISDFLCACADATIQVNGSDVGTAASGGTYDQEIENSNGDAVGTSANPSIVSDSTVENSDQSYQGTVKAEGTLVLPDITVTDSDGSTSSVPSVQDVMCTPCAPSGSISVSVSNATPSTGDTITIEATASGFTPNNYIFFSYDGSTIEEIVEQSGNTYNWLVDRAGTYDVYALATNGTVNSYGFTEIEAASGFVCDQISTAPIWGVSLRRLTNSYNGSAATVRRSSDNATLDIGFVGEDLDTAALIAFVGAGNGFSAILYDQFNGDNATQVSASAQPRMVLSGTIDTLGGKPTIVFNGTSNLLNLSTNIDMAHGFVVAKNNSLTVDSQFVLGNSNNRGLNWGGDFNSPGFYTLSLLTSGGNLVSAVRDLNTHQVSVRLGTSGNGRLRVDGSIVDTGTTSLTEPINTIGARSPSIGQRFPGSFSEAIIYGSALSEADELVIENNQIAYYDI